MTASCKQAPGLVSKVIKFLFPWKVLRHESILFIKEGDFPSTFSSLSKVGSSQTFGLLQAGLRDCSQPLPL